MSTQHRKPLFAIPSAAEIESFNKLNVGSGATAEERAAAQFDPHSIADQKKMQAQRAGAGHRPISQVPSQAPDVHTPAADQKKAIDPGVPVPTNPNGFSLNSPLTVFPVTAIPVAAGVGSDIPPHGVIRTGASIKAEEPSISHGLKEVFAAVGNKIGDLATTVYNVEKRVLNAELNAAKRVAGAVVTGVKTVVGTEVAAVKFVAGKLGPAVNAVEKETGAVVKTIGAAASNAAEIVTDGGKAIDNASQAVGAKVKGVEAYVRGDMPLAMEMERKVGGKVKVAGLEIEKAGIALSPDAPLKPFADRAKEIDPINGKIAEIENPTPDRRATFRGFGLQPKSSNTMENRPDMNQVFNLEGKSSMSAGSTGPSIPRSKGGLSD